MNIYYILEQTSSTTSLKKIKKNVNFSPFNEALASYPPMGPARLNPAIGLSFTFNCGCSTCDGGQQIVARLHR